MRREKFRIKTFKPSLLLMGIWAGRYLFINLFKSDSKFMIEQNQNFFSMEVIEDHYKVAQNKFN